MGEVRRKCCKCLKVKPKSGFYSDRTRKHGFGYMCISCKKDVDAERFKARVITKIDKVKEVARTKTKLIYKEKYYCCVLSCKRRGEFHHIDYDDPKAVIPLCRLHHRLVHTLETIYDKFTNPSREDEL